MSKKFLSGINVTGAATLNTVADAGSNTDKFLVLDSSNNVSYRTAAELYADLGIGSTAAAYTSTLKHEVKASQTISKGQAVYVSSADGTNMIVSKASNVSEATSSKTMGLLETSLVTNAKGNVITEGLLSGLNTSSATAGDPVWLGTNGDLIFGLANKPYAPAHLVFIGVVTRVNANNGEIFVKVQNGFEMNELHNYAEGSVQNNQVIVYESSTSLYKPKTIPTILGYTPVPDNRTITINGTTYDLTANRSWTITTDASARTILRYVATANQTTFTISGGYTPGLTDVYRNGIKLDNTTDFTATNGTTIVLTNGASVNDVIEVYRYQTAFLPNNALRVITEFVATAGQTTFNVNYNSGLVDVFYNGSKLISTEYTTGNGTSIVLNFACNLNDTIEVHAYSYAVGAFTGQAQLNGTGLVRMNGTTVSYDNNTYLTATTVLNAVLTPYSVGANTAVTTTDTIETAIEKLQGQVNARLSSINSSQVTTALGFTPYNATNPSGYITSSALSSYLPLSGGTLTGALSGTSATFSGNVTLSSGGDNLTLARSGFTSWGFGVGTVAGINGLHIGAGASTYLSLNQSTGAATFSSSVTNTSGMLLNVGANGSNANTTYTTFANGVYSALNSATPSEGIGMWSDNQGNGMIGSLYDNTASSLNFVVRASSSTNGKRAMVINGSGNVGIGTSSPATRFQVSGGQIRCIDTYNNTTATAANLVVSAGGTFERSTSSIRFKKDVEDLQVDTSLIISKMRPIWYRSKCDNDRKDWSWYGFIAEELAEIEPRLVQWGYEETDHIINEETNQIELKEDAKLIAQGVQYERITVLLVKAIQEQNQLIQELQSQINEIKGK